MSVNNIIAGIEMIAQTVSPSFGNNIDEEVGQNLVTVEQVLGNFNLEGMVVTDEGLLSEEMHAKLCEAIKDGKSVTGTCIICTVKPVKMNPEMAMTNVGSKSSIVAENYGRVKTELS